MKKNIRIFIIVIIVALIAFLAWFAFSREWQGNDYLNYVNTKHQFSFQYPPDWHMSGNAESDIIQIYSIEQELADGGLPLGVRAEIIILENYEKMELDEWVNWINKKQEGESKVATHEKIKIGGISAIRESYLPTFDNEGPPISVYLAQEDNIILINYLGGEPDYTENMKELERLLQSWSFQPRG
jgi:hypothetical protein